MIFLGTDPVLHCEFILSCLILIFLMGNNLMKSYMFLDSSVDFNPFQ